MDSSQLGVIAFQVLGLAYLVGGACAAHLATVKPVSAPAKVVDQKAPVAWTFGTPLPGAADAARRGWRLASALLFMGAGAAMAVRDEAAPAVLGALLTQQILYLVRQRMAELERARASDAAEQRPSVLTTRMFILTTVCALLAAYLQGAALLR